MGRTIRTGISFYRVNSGHILNPKVRLLMNEFHGDGYFIWKCLLDQGYTRNGYYFDTTDKDELELFAVDYCRMKLSTIKEVINGCIRRDLFDKGVADAFGILTCGMMQETFLIATADRRSKGTSLDMIAEYLLIKIPPETRNISIVPLNNEIVPPNNRKNPPNNPQIREEKNRSDQKRESGPGGPALAKENFDKGGKKKFLSPSLAEIQGYFISCMCDTKQPNPWPEDRSKNAGANFFDHYTANGWVQGEGKPIQDWQAAARKWIRKELTGIFAPAVPPAAIRKQAQPVPAAPSLDKHAADINYLYDRYLDGNCTIISIEVAHYGYLKRTGLMQISDDDKIRIREIAQGHLREKELDPNDNAMLDPVMKKFAILHLFRQLQVAERTEVFTLKN